MKNIPILEYSERPLLAGSRQLLRTKTDMRTGGMVRHFRTLGAFLLSIVAGLAAAQGIPDLSGYDSETRISMQSTCVSEHGKGPVAYGACLNGQIESLKSSPGIPDLSGYDSETRISMQSACVSEHGKGPVAYGACLRQHVESLGTLLRSQ